MKARVLMGNYRKPGGLWKKNPIDARPADSPVLHNEDIKIFKFEIDSLQAKSVLEFGPGESTEVFAKLGLHVTTVEHIEKWLELAKERFKGYPNVRVLKGDDEMPFVVHGMGSYEKFDLAFVDTPAGYFPRRKIHKGYEDCSRFNTTLFALQHAPVVFLHDVNRPLERGTLGRLNQMGYHIEVIRVPYGMARITHGDQDRPDIQGAKESGGAPAGGES